VATRHVAERIRADLLLPLPAPPTGEQERSPSRLGRLASWIGRLPSWMTVPAALLALGGVLSLATVIWLQVFHTIRHPKPIPVRVPPRVSGVVWGHRVFVDVRSLRSALSARGVSYQAWARNHPAAKTILRSRTRHR
jgi:hypothetical protein